MSRARINTYGLLWAMASLIIATPAAMAERTDQEAVVQLAASRDTLAPLMSPVVSSSAMQAINADSTHFREVTPTTAGCVRPDADTLRAILPVATDHGSYATGVVYDTNRVLTAAHAVQGGGQFYVRIGHRFRIADLVMLDSDNDLAVLAVDTQAIEPLHISGFDPAESQPVWAVGYPRAQGMMTSTGILQDSREGALHTSASIDSGQSGGGLLSCQNGSWEMLGMLRGYGAYLQGGHYVKRPNHSVSVAAATINRFLLTYH